MNLITNIICNYINYDKFSFSILIELCSIWVWKIHRIEIKIAEKWDFMLDCPASEKMVRVSTHSHSFSGSFVCLAVCEFFCMLPFYPWEVMGADGVWTDVCGLVVSGPQLRSWFCLRWFTNWHFSYKYLRPHRTLILIFIISTPCQTNNVRRNSIFQLDQCIVNKF